MNNGILATFQCQENAEKAFAELKEDLDCQGVTVISRGVEEESNISNFKDKDPLDSFSSIANQVVETATRTGTLVGNISGMAVVGLFSLPLLVAAPLINGFQQENASTEVTSTQEKQIVTVSGNSDLKKAKDILVRNGARIYPQ